MGFPDELPAPKNHKFEWQTNPVPLKDEEALAKFVIKKGEFGLAQMRDYFDMSEKLTKYNRILGKNSPIDLERFQE